MCLDERRLTATRELIAQKLVNMPVWTENTIFGG